MIMDHLVAADILIGEQAALPIVPGKPISTFESEIWNVERDCPHV